MQQCQKVLWVSYFEVFVFHGFNRRIKHEIHNFFLSSRLSIMDFDQATGKWDYLFYFTVWLRMLRLRFWGSIMILKTGVTESLKRPSHCILRLANFKKFQTRSFTRQIPTHAENREQRKWGREEKKQYVKQKAVEKQKRFERNPVCPLAAPFSVSLYLVSL